MNIEEVREKIGELLKEYESIMKGGTDYAILEEALKNEQQSRRAESLRVLMELIELLAKEKEMEDPQ
jgi:hypothetical protein